MEPPRHHGLGLHPHRQAHVLGEPAPLTAPISPVDDLSVSSALLPRSADTKSSKSTSMAPPHAIAGHFSYGPATQQTVVTTTTTTTVSFPPLLIKPPQDLHNRDPRQYPLAFTPTPHGMKRFCIDIAGRPTVYKEAEDVNLTLRKVGAGQCHSHEANLTLSQHQQRQAALHAVNGAIRSERVLEPPYDTPSRIRQDIRSAPRPIEFQARRPPTPPFPPPSLAEAAELASVQRRRKKPRSLLSRSASGRHDEELEFEALKPRAGALHSSLSPVTPCAESSSAEALAEKASDMLLRGVTAPDLEKGRRREQLNQLDNAALLHVGQRLAGATATPPVAESDLEPLAADAALTEPATRFPATLLPSSQQDVSLPSPSLSPVTAAANLARSRSLPGLKTNVDDDDDEDNTSEVSGLDLEEEVPRTASRLLPPYRLPSVQSQLPATPHTRQTPPLTVMDIPSIVEAFDGMPEELQTYVLYQMLRRCSKKTLSTVAEVVNPALKCDPFDVLPTELGLQITKLLDGPSLCKASQVSKRWRHLTNSDEKAWKDLLDRDGFTITAGEIERAVREGWGYQFSGPDGAEEHLGLRKPPRSQTDADIVPCSPTGPLSTLISEDVVLATASRLRTKRKAVTMLAGPKKQKRKSTHGQDEALNWIQDLERAQGPNAFASAAAKAVPNPQFGLPSLHSLHLFKSIYQRNYMIRHSWMDSHSRPHHIAFRAHHRHVVTCLLFDSDKIITGSDDTSINVYDTKTGVLRKKLEGHEGGVWALQCDGNTLVSGSTDRSVRVWDIAAGRCLQTLQGHTSTVRCLVILKPTEIGKSADGQPIMAPEEPVIITGSRDSTLRVWQLPKPDDEPYFQAGPAANDRDNAYSLRTLTGHHSSVRALAAHGNTLVSGSYDFSVRVWKISTGDLVHRLAGHTAKVYSVVLDYERGRCISGSMDNLVKVWSLETGVCLFNLEGHSSLVGLLDLSHGHLVSAAADSTLRIWDPENGNCRSTLSAHTGAITCFQHDGQKVVSGSDRTLKMWNVNTGECVRDLLTDLSGVWQVRFDERRCVAAVQRNNLTYIEVLDFGASRDGVLAADLGRRIVVDLRGKEVDDENVVELHEMPNAAR